MSLGGWIALVVAALAVFAIANYFPIVTLALSGQVVHASLPAAIILTWQQGHPTVALMTGMVGFVLPLLQLSFLLWALLVIASKRLPADFRYGMRLLHAIASWSMVPVLMLGILVAIVKLADIATPTIGPAMWAFGVLTFLITGLGRMSAHRLWRYAEDQGLVPISGAALSTDGQVANCSSCAYVQHVDMADHRVRCRRCGAGLHKRKPDSFSRTWALVVTASILYIPANILPVMEIRTPFGDTAHTILGGALELWRSGSWDLALIVFVASVLVPLTKLLSLMVLMINRKWKGAAIQRQRTRLFVFIEFIGQWSMLDVFVVILLTAMANFPGMSQIKAGPGAASFGLVVVLTMLAAASFDPRIGWDRQWAASGRPLKEKFASSYPPDADATHQPG